MSYATDYNDLLLPSYERAPTFLEKIRKTSLDELPQIFNILKGDITFVGLRPIHVEYYQYYNDYERQKLKVKPRITSYVQIDGRNKISWEENFDLDVYYVNNKSFFLDMKIIILTVVRGLKYENINPTDKKIYDFVDRRIFLWQTIYL